MTRRLHLLGLLQFFFLFAFAVQHNEPQPAKTASWAGDILSKLYGSGTRPMMTVLYTKSSDHPLGFEMYIGYNKAGSELSTFLRKFNPAVEQLAREAELVGANGKPTKPKPLPSLEEMHAGRQMIQLDRVQPDSYRHYRIGDGTRSKDSTTMSEGQVRMEFQPETIITTERSAVVHSRHGITGTPMTAQLQTSGDYASPVLDDPAEASWRMQKIGHDDEVSRHFTDPDMLHRFLLGHCCEDHAAQMLYRMDNAFKNKLSLADFAFTFEMKVNAKAGDVNVCIPQRCAKCHGQSVAKINVGDVFIQSGKTLLFDFEFRKEDC